MDREEVLHVAELSRLKFSEEQLKQMGGYLDAVLGQMKSLDKVDVSAVKASAHILSAVNVLREDKAMPSMDREQLLANAPETFDGCYIVPKVLE